MSNAIKLMSDQGYVPATCTLPEPLAFALILSEVKKGNSPCDGCNMDRSVCKGQPNTVDKTPVEKACESMGLNTHMQDATGTMGIKSRESNYPRKDDEGSEL